MADLLPRQKYKSSIPRTTDITIQKYRDNSERCIDSKIAQ